MSSILISNFSKVICQLVLIRICLFPTMLRTCMFYVRNIKLLIFSQKYFTAKILECSLFSIHNIIWKDANLIASFKLLTSRMQIHKVLDEEEIAFRWNTAHECQLLRCSNPLMPKLISFIRHVCLYHINFFYWKYLFISQHLYKCYFYLSM